MVDRAYLERLTRELADEGKLVESGWVSLRLMAIPENASALQLEEMRNAFFAGAQHVFGSMMAMFDEGEEATEADMRRMDLMSAELNEFIDKFKLKHVVTHGGRQ
jgi:hypothetical protein